MDNKLYRVNIRVSKKIKSYFESKSKDTGVSQSSLMAMAIDEYIDQKIMIEQAEKQVIHAENQKVLADKMNEIINKIEEIKKCK